MYLVYAFDNYAPHSSRSIPTYVNTIVLANEILENKDANAIVSAIDSLIQNTTMFEGRFQNSAGFVLLHRETLIPALSMYYFLAEDDDEEYKGKSFADVDFNYRVEFLR